jgi:membrane fusion protein, heavy metal efflux system
MSIGSRAIEWGVKALQSGQQRLQNDLSARIAAAVVIVSAIAFATYEIFFSGTHENAAPVEVSATLNTAPSLDLSAGQVQSIRVAGVGRHTFAVQKAAVGSIDFDEDLSVQVFTPYQGRIISATGKIGDDVKKGQILFTIESPDLLNAESNLISAAGVLDMSNAALVRAQKMLAAQSAAQKDVEAALSAQITAEGAYKSARDAVLIFGKTDAEVSRIVREKRVDPELVVRSPIAGRITARNAQPGLLVQPGNAPAPFSVADVSRMWMVASVPEVDAPTFAIGQPIRVSVMAYSGRTFEGHITALGATVDPNTHTVLARSEILDPDHLLRPGMFATFEIFTGAPVTATAVPVNAVVREGDGTMTVWVTKNGHRFTQRKVQVGLTGNGYDQIVSGLVPGERVATDGAVFLDNMITADVTD